MSPLFPPPAPGNAEPPRPPAWRRYLRFWGARVGDDVDDELAFHLDMRIRDYVERGMSEDGARAAAAARVGGLRAARTACLTIGHRRQRRMTRAGMVDAFIQDVRYAWRTLGRQLGWTAIAVLTLGLGIGATTAVFGVVNSLILHPLPYRHADRVVNVLQLDAKSGSTRSATAEMIDIWQKYGRTIEAVEPYQAAEQTITGAGDPATVAVGTVRPSFFAFTGIGTIFGRGFSAEEARRGGPHVAVISEQLWRARYGASQDILGKSIVLDDRAFTVIGVSRGELRLPAVAQARTDVWLPFGADTLTFNRSAVARLKPGVTDVAAASELDALIRENGLVKGVRDENFRARLIRPGDMVWFRSSLYLLSGAVALLMLVACANVAHLLLARGVTRERELAIRAALGAGRARLGRQLLTESLLLAAIGCVLGVLVGFGGIRALLALRPPALAQLSLAQLDERTLVVAIAMSLLTGLIFGCTAAIHVVRRTTSDSLRATSLTGTAAKSSHRLRSFLVVTETGVSALLLVGAVLVVRSVAHLQSLDPGFQPRDLYALTVDLPSNRYQSASERSEFVDAVVARARGVTGVSAVALASVPPSQPVYYTVAGLEAEASAAKGLPDDIAKSNVGEDYFHVLGIPLIEGRSFTGGAGTRREVIINAGLARTLWPGQSAVGRRVRFASWSGQPNEWDTIVGVAGDVAMRGLSRGRDDPLLYYPLSGENFYGQMTVLVRAQRGISPISALHSIVPALDQRLIPPPVRTAESMLVETIASQRFTMTLLAIFAALAVTLSAIGLYGVISYVVTQRTREIGIRIALGATPRNVARTVIARGFVLSLLGLGLGLGAAVWGTKLIRTSLYGVTDTDPVSYVAAGAVLLAISLVACVVPMRRAMSVDPVIAMRGD